MASAHSNEVPDTTFHSSEDSDDEEYLVGENDSERGSTDHAKEESESDGELGGPTDHAEDVSESDSELGGPTDHAEDESESDSELGGPTDRSESDSEEGPTDHAEEESESDSDGGPTDHAEEVDTSYDSDENSHIKSRKRHRRPSNWIKNKRSAQRNTGQSYTSTSGQHVSPQLSLSLASFLFLFLHLRLYVIVIFHCCRFQNEELTTRLVFVLCDATIKCLLNNAKGYLMDSGHQAILMCKVLIFVVV